MMMIMAVSSLARIVGRPEFSQSYILQALWWLKSPMPDAQDLLHFGQMNASDLHCCCCNSLFFIQLCNQDCGSHLTSYHIVEVRVVFVLCAFIYCYLLLISVFYICITFCNLLCWYFVKRSCFLLSE
jgi:hypothetical protein